MSCKFTCDGCGKEQPARAINKKHKKSGVDWWWWEKPEGWLQRGEGDGLFDVCSKECAIKINEKTGLHAPIEGKPI